MFKDIRYKIACLLSPQFRKDKESVDKIISQRVAEIILKMDPFEPLMKKFNGTFSVEYERVEDQLNEQGKIGMYMWAWQQVNDPYFKHMVDWIMNKSGNSALKLGNPTEMQIFFKRAEIANMILFRKEIGRLSSHYEDLMAKRKSNDFNPEVGVE